jgi:hypothetical protein
LENRWDRFETTFQEWALTQPYHWRVMMPLHPIDISVFEPFRTAIFASETEDIEIKKDDIDRVVKEWSHWRDSLLFSLLPEELQIRYQADRPSLQPLAIFRFTSLTIKNRVITEYYRPRRDIDDPEVQSLLTPDQRKIHAAVVKSKLSNLCPFEWSYPDLQFDTAGFEVTVEVLKFLKMDPYTTTLKQIADYKGKFRCRDTDHTGSHTCWSMVRRIFLWVGLLIDMEY